MKRKWLKISLWVFGVLFGVLIIGLLWFGSQFNTQKVAEDVYMISSPTGANVTVVKGNDGIFLVDTQLKPMNFFIKRHISNISEKPVKYIVNTHWHPDHNGGNGQLGQNATIIGHENLKKRLSSPQKGYGLTKPGSYHEFKSREPADLPNKTFTDSLQLNFNGQNVVVFHAPNSHTDADAVVYFMQSNVLCVGDLIWKDKFPYVDNFNKGSVIGLSRILDRLIANTDSITSIISGHSAISSKEDLIKTREMIKKSVAHVQKRISGGQTLSQIQKDGLPTDLKSWSGDLTPESSWIEMVYKSLN